MNLGLVNGLTIFRALGNLAYSCYADRDICMHHINDLPPCRTEEQIILTSLLLAACMQARSRLW